MWPLLPATAEALPRGTRQLDLRHRAKLSQMVRLPVVWKRNTEEEEPSAYVLWFMHRYVLQLELGALACWERLSCKLSTVFRRRQLLLYALKQDSVPDGFQDPSMSVNVHRMGLDAQARPLPVRTSGCDWARLRGPGSAPDEGLHGSLAAGRLRSDRSPRQVRVSSLSCATARPTDPLIAACCLRPSSTPTLPSCSRLPGRRRPPSRAGWSDGARRMERKQWLED